MQQSRAKCARWDLPFQSEVTPGMPVVLGDALDTTFAAYGSGGHRFGSSIPRRSGDNDAMVSVALLCIAGFAVGMAISATKSRAPRQLVWGFWGAAAFALVLAGVTAAT
jgi:hypothetical protein